jgi:hypothetical protein
MSGLLHHLPRLLDFFRHDVAERGDAGVVHA